MNDATEEGPQQGGSQLQHSQATTRGKKAKAGCGDSHEDGREVATAAVDEAKASLSAQDRYRLTLWKWRYSFERLGFENSEVSNLVFLLWRVRTGKVQ